jgi:RNase P subunit RPR2
MGYIPVDVENGKSRGKNEIRSLICKMMKPPLFQKLNLNYDIEKEEVFNISPSNSNCGTSVMYKTKHNTKLQSALQMVASKQASR